MALFVSRKKDQWRSETTIDERGLLVRNHYEIYEVRSDSWIEPFYAQSATNLYVFSVCPYDPGARLKGVTAAIDPERRSPWYYTVNVTYSTETPTATQQNIQYWNPLDDEPDIEIDGEPLLYPVWKDLDGKMIANTANQPITDVNEERNIEVITINRNEPILNTSRDRYYRGTVNAYAYAGAARGTLKITRIRATREYRNEFKFYKYYYEIRYNEKGWQPEILNAGVKQLTGSGTSLRYIDCKDSDSMPVSSPVPLDVNGRQLPQSLLPGSANFLKFKTIRETDFSALGFPLSG